MGRGIRPFYEVGIGKKRRVHNKKLSQMCACVCVCVFTTTFYKLITPTYQHNKSTPEWNQHQHQWKRGKSGQICGNHKETQDGKHLESKRASQEEQKTSRGGKQRIRGRVGTNEGGKSETTKKGEPTKPRNPTNPNNPYKSKLTHSGR